MSCRLGAVVLAFVALTHGTAAAERPLPQRLVIPMDVEPGELTPQGAVPYNTVFLNRCPNGCPIRVGAPSSITDSWYIGSARTLTSFPYGDEAWNQVVACMRDVFSPFQINLTEQNPGSANHFEIMIAGRSTDLGMSSSIGGVAPGSCAQYVNNALVFAFAKSYGNNTDNTCDARCVNELCATAAQEIGHVWRGMDHVRVAADPMTYFGYTKRRYFQNTDAQCGSDCVNGIAPNGSTCDGANNQSHACNCTGLQTQNSYNVIKDLFGLGPGSPPTVKITAPKLGQNVDPGFAVYSEAMDDSGEISKVELKINGQVVSSLTAPPFVFNAPDNLANGTVRVEIVAYDPHQTPGTAQVDVVIGPPCKGEDDCKEEDVCVGGRCVPGSGVNGGLGTTCTAGTDCLSNQCASDGTNSYCVEQCMIGDCPDGYGCLDTGNGTSVCWPGYDDGSGGCGCQSSRGGPLSMVLALGVMVVLCRRRRR
jgi:MYXO-CTERM domain-containing protein